MSENHVADFSSYIREKFCPMEMAPMSEKKLSDFASYTSVKMLHFNRDISKRTLAIPEYFWTSEVIPRLEALTDMDRLLTVFLLTVRDEESSSIEVVVDFPKRFHIVFV